MRKILLICFATLALLLTGLAGYGFMGWNDAVRQADVLRKRADSVMTAGLGPDSLTPQQLRVLLLVQDPGFYDHSGVDFSTPGAGMTTLTQSLSKRLAFDKFTPGIGKIRQTGFALGLDRQLSKKQQIALFLQTLEMGQSKSGWVTGFHKASETFFDKPVNETTEEEFYMLVAVLIAPNRLKLAQPDATLNTRVQRIAKLAQGACKPSSFNDVWLEGCK
ncbi:hypothetical protein MNBD_ALPHA08-536 [hydrothermal vent metagenome]|uniref:Glycosyl transferase family 51 domain-containing protein n=1 Tax=hydrothermal vent metagenome TaxID=652676 RepID=A0A3B0SFW8_9ZZZZ